jgi:hypothetical protein
MTPFEPEDAGRQDVQPAPGYWKASDGNWYPAPPEDRLPPPPTDYVTPPTPMTNGMATAALVLGIIGVCLFWAVGAGVVCGILAVVFGAFGMSKAIHLPGRYLRGRALAGLILGGIAIVLGSLVFVVIVLVGGTVDTDESDGRCDDSRYFQDPDCD